jgi:hypothetical protein
MTVTESSTSGVDASESQPYHDASIAVTTRDRFMKLPTSLRAVSMKHWSLRLKMIVLVVGLVTGSSLAASAVHGWLAFSALKDEVRGRAAGIASEIAYGIDTPGQLAENVAHIGHTLDQLLTRNEIAVERLNCCARKRHRGDGNDVADA